MIAGSLVFDSDDAKGRLETRLHPVDQVSLAIAPFSDFDFSGERPERPVLRDASVLVALIDRPEGLSVLLTQRTNDMPTHAGQIAFPGGRRHADDPDAVWTALREAREEVGLDPDLVRVVGTADAYQTVTSYRITPIVGLVDPRATFERDPREVADIFEVPFSFLMNPQNHQTHSREWNGQTRTYLAMPFGDRYIWGATAGMLRALHARLYL